MDEATLEEIKDKIPPCPWVVVNYKDAPVKWECQRCGETVPTLENVRFDTFIWMSTGFRIAHSNCKEGDK